MENSLIVYYIKFAAVVFTVGYLAMAVCIWALQDRMIFLPQPAGVGIVPVPSRWTTEEVSFVAPDGVNLHATLVKPPGEPAPLIIYFGGNAEDVSYLAQFADRYGRFALLLPDYRSFGKSGGSAGEASLFADAVLVYDAIIRRTDILGSRVYTHGRSLGSGVAVFLATQRPIAGIVLTTPYDSLTNVASGMYPLLPVSLLLKHKFDSLSRARGIKTRALFLVAEEDRLIPPKHSKGLYQAWAGPKEWYAFTGRDHNDVSEAPGYWDTIAAFMRRSD